MNTKDINEEEEKKMVEDLRDKNGIIKASSHQWNESEFRSDCPKQVTSTQRIL